MFERAFLLVAQQVTLAPSYKDEQINMIVDKRVRCSEIKSIPQNCTRTMTNVGPANSTYSLELEVPLALNECKPNSDTILRGKPEGYFLG
ncbi:hypothetical protein K1719_041364 [Acacia pycnantha]|nr:hypothetical protein K1719_041364 [Acacia pycnantha]